MRVTIDADNEHAAVDICNEIHGWTPDAIREVDSGNDETRAWLCFDDATDALMWDAQK